MDRISTGVCLVIISFKILFVMFVHIKCKGSSQKRQLVGKLLSMRGEISEYWGESQWLQYELDNGVWS